MNSTNVKTLVVVFAVLIATSIIAVGCKSKSKSGLMNTSTLPGHTFSKHGNKRTSSSTIVYLGADKPSQDVNFGPRDVNFEFQNLR